MTTVSISVTDELRKRLDEHGKGFNISAVCREALERELAIHEKLSGEQKLTMVERLKPEAVAGRAGVQAEGRDAGVEWAQHAASYEELVELTESVAESGGLPLDDAQVYLAGQVAFDAVKEWHPQAQPTRFASYWYKGFITGVVEAFEKVRHEIES